MNANLRFAAVVTNVLALATVAFAAEPVTRLSAEDLLRLARPTAGECYLTKPPATVTGAPERLFTWAAAGGSMTVRVPVPADGYYEVRSTILWGPWAEGRFGRFVLTGGPANFPNAYQGWYGTPPTPPYRFQEQVWGIAHLSAPAVDLSFEPAGGGGRLMILGDLRLEPRAAEGLKPEELERRVPAAVAACASATTEDPAWPLFDLQQRRGTEGTVFVPRASQSPQLDAKLIPERGTLEPGAPLRYVGTIDAQGPATLKAIEVVPLAHLHACGQLRFESSPAGGGPLPCLGPTAAAGTAARAVRTEDRLEVADKGVRNRFCQSASGLGGEACFPDPTGGAIPLIRQRRSCAELQFAASYRHRFGSYPPRPGWSGPRS